MPTKNPRLTMTLSPALKEQLERLSALTGNSQGSLVAEILESATPVFARLIQVLEAAQVAKAEMGTDFSSGLEAAQQQLEGQLGLVLDVMDEAAAPIVKKADEVKRRGRRAGGAAAPADAETGALTPPSNRGVRFTPKTGKNSNKSKAFA